MIKKSLIFQIACISFSIYFSGCSHRFSNKSRDPARTTELSHKMHVTGVFFKNRIDPESGILHESRWTEEIIRKRLSLTAEIYKQCGIEMTFQVVQKSLPEKNGSLIFSRGDLFDEFTRIAIMNEIPKSVRPVVIYIAEFYNVLALAYSKSSERQWVNRRNKHQGELMRYSVWLGHDNIEDDKNMGGGFVTEAHEIGHLLHDVGKTNIGNMKYDYKGHVISEHHNLMSSYKDYLNTELTTQQCQKILKSPLVKRK